MASASSLASCPSTHLKEDEEGKPGCKDMPELDSVAVVLIIPVIPVPAAETSQCQSLSLPDPLGTQKSSGVFTHRAGCHGEGLAGMLPSTDCCYLHTVVPFLTKSKISTARFVSGSKCLIWKTERLWLM